VLVLQIWWLWCQTPKPNKAKPQKRERHTSLEISELSGSSGKKVMHFHTKMLYLFPTYLCTIMFFIAYLSPGIQQKPEDYCHYKRKGKGGKIIIYVLFTFS